MRTYLRTFRRRVGLAQHEVATALGCTSSSISRHERGVQEPSLDALLAYHILYGVSLADIYPHLYNRKRREMLQRLRRMERTVPVLEGTALKRRALCAAAVRCGGKEEQSSNPHASSFGE